jgi:hypothetical protein
VKEVSSVALNYLFCKEKITRLPPRASCAALDPIASRCAALHLNTCVLASIVLAGKRCRQKETVKLDLAAMIMDRRLGSALGSNLVAAMPRARGEPVSRFGQVNAVRNRISCLEWVETSKRARRIL